MKSRWNALLSTWNRTQAHDKQSQKQQSKPKTDAKTQAEQTPPSQKEYSALILRL
jgi:hypothetical protein